MNSIGHGYVFPRADGIKTRCGGPPQTGTSFRCPVCALEVRYKEAGYTELPIDYENHEPKAQAVGTISLDVTLFIRLLEIAREDLKSDADLHYLVDRVVDAQSSSTSDVLSMDDYPNLVESKLVVAQDRQKLLDRLEELSDEIEKASDKGVAVSKNQIKERHKLIEDLRSRELTAGPKEGEVSKTLTISGEPEKVDRVLALLALIYYNGHWGHSGTFGIIWDGDGSDSIDIDIDLSEYRDLTNTLSSYGGEAEIVGEDRTPFVVRGGDNGYLSYKKVEITPRINASTRLFASTEITKFKEGLSKIYPYHDQIPLQSIKKLAKSCGVTLVDDDGSEWEGILAGRKGRCSIDLKVKDKVIKPCLHIQWSKLMVGKYEVNCYIL